MPHGYMAIRMQLKAPGSVYSVTLQPGCSAWCCCLFVECVHVAHVCRDEGDWWAAVTDDEWPSDPNQRAMILADFLPPYGDRRQELVFIGIGMDQTAIEAALDECLLTEHELTMYDANWAKLPDPVHAEAPPAAPVGQQS